MSRGRSSEFPTLAIPTPVVVLACAGLLVLLVARACSVLETDPAATQAAFERLVSRQLPRGGWELTGEEGLLPELRFMRVFLLRRGPAPAQEAITARVLAQSPAWTEDLDEAELPAAALAMPELGVESWELEGQGAYLTWVAGETRHAIPATVLQTGGPQDPATPGEPMPTRLALELRFEGPGPAPGTRELESLLRALQPTLP
jgi:hypothetical protein